MPEDVKQRRSSPVAFKRQAVAPIHGGRSVSQVAVEPALPDRLIHSWLRHAKESPPPAGGASAQALPRAQLVQARHVGSSPADQAAGIAPLRKTLDPARMERNIVKQVVRIIGRTTDQR